MNRLRTMSLAMISLAAPTPAQDPADFGKWVDYLRPKAEEQAWETIPWLQSFRDGMRAASEQQKPLLLWLMNGHPLGCT